MLTCDVDVTALISFGKEKRFKFYTVFICVVSRVINGDNHFKMGLDMNGKPVVYDDVYPCYTDFIPEHEDFATIITSYSSDMKKLYERITVDRQKHKDKPGAAPDRDVDNIFLISALPWVNYSSLNIHYYNEWAGLAPLVFWGKYEKKEGKIMLPVTLQVRHAVCDGYHAAKFFMDLEKAVPEVIRELY